MDTDVSKGGHQDAQLEDRAGICRDLKDWIFYPQFKSHQFSFQTHFCER